MPDSVTITLPSSITLPTWLLYILVGLIAGLLASIVMRGRGFGLIGDFILGVLGAVVGGFALGAVGIRAFSLLGNLVIAFIGAILILALTRVVRRA